MNNGNGSSPEAAVDVRTSIPARGFLCDGVEWLAWPSGSGAYGTGTCGPASVEAVHFATADAPDTPVFEALLPTGRFHGLYEDELIMLLKGATRVVDSAQRPAKPVSRRGVGLL
jgi:hypothetical protein